MKVSMLVKGATIVALGVCSLVVTRSIIAQKQKPKPTPRAAAPGARGVLVRNAVPKGEIRVSRLPGPGPDEPNYHFMDVQGQDGVLTIAAQWNVLIPKVKDYSLMWVVVITDAKAKGLARRQCYPGEMFQPQAGVLRKAMFLDRFDVGPGEYNVDLNLCRVAPGMDPMTVGANPEKFTQCGFLAMQSYSSTAPAKD